MLAAAELTSQKGRGFTLVELLIAISLLGLISIVTYSAIWTISRGLESVEQRVDANDELRVTLAFMQRALSQARGVMVIRDKRMQMVFSGSEQRLTFVAPAPLQLGHAGGLYRYQLELAEKGAGGEQLRLSYWQHLSETELDEGLEPQGEVALIDGVEDLSFSFFGRDEPWKKEKWLNEWHYAVSLPKLVRISLNTSAVDRDITMTVAIKGAGGL